MVLIDSGIDQPLLQDIKWHQLSCHFSHYYQKLGIKYSFSRKLVGYCLIQ